MRRATKKKKRGAPAWSETRSSRKSTTWRCTTRKVVYTGGKQGNPRQDRGLRTISGKVGQLAKGGRRVKERKKNKKQLLSLPWPSKRKLGARERASPWSSAAALWTSGERNLRRGEEDQKAKGGQQKK